MSFKGLLAVGILGLGALWTIHAVADIDLADRDALGPAPRDSDGRFTNLNGALSHGTFGVRFPFMMRRLGTLFRSGSAAPTRVGNDGVYLRENATESDWGGSVLTSPMIPESNNRSNPNPDYHLCHGGDRTGP